MSRYINQIEFLERTICLVDNLSKQTKWENTLFLNLCLGLLIAPQQWEDDSLCQIPDVVDNPSWFLNPALMAPNEPRYADTNPLSVENIAYHFRNCFCHHHFVVMDNGVEIDRIQITDFKLSNKEQICTFDYIMTFHDFKKFVLKYANEKLTLLRKL